jgi:large subunit ribosomal protein L15
MNLNTLKPAAGSVKTKKRIGRGIGSGMGNTATRGHKGAKSRSGYKTKKGFEGGQMPLQRRIPKFGFKSPNRIELKPINLDTIQELVEKTGESTVNMDLLIKNGLAGKSDLVKVLGRGELKSKVQVSAHSFSASAIEAIEKAGGSVSKL